MSSREHAKAVARKVTALAGGATVQRKAAARELARLDPVDATELIQHLLLLAREGCDPAYLLLTHLTAALETEAAQIPYAGSLKRLARLQDHVDVAALFPEDPPVKEMDERAAAKADAVLFNQTLGFVKTRARVTTDPDELSRLASASDASVMRELLLNPRLTEELVVRIAARRPARPEPLVEIWRSSRWSALHAVRRALVFNPYLPPSVGAKIVPLLSGTDLRELSRDNAVHAALKEQAQLLLERD